MAFYALGAFQEGLTRRAFTPTPFNASILDISSIERAVHEAGAGSVSAFHRTLRTVTRLAPADLRRADALDALAGSFARSFAPRSRPRADRASGA